MAENTAYSVAITSSACVDNPIVRSKMKRDRVRTFESKREAEEWVDDLNRLCENELVLKDAYLSGETADGVLKSSRAQPTWSGI